MILLRKPSLICGKRRLKTKTLFCCTLLCALLFVTASCRFSNDDDSYIESLSLIPLKTEYEVGDRLNPITDLRVYAVTSSGTVKEIPIEYYTIDPDQFQSSGIITVQVNYEGVVGIYTVTVIGDGGGGDGDTYIIIDVNW